MTIAMDVGWQLPELYSSSSAKPSGGSTSAKKHVWSEDPEKILSLMMGKPEHGGGSTSSPPPEAVEAPIAASLQQQQPSEIIHLDYEQDVPLPSGWEKRLDLKSGSISFVNCSTGMSTSNDPRALQFDPNSVDRSHNNKIHSSSSLSENDSPISTLDPEDTQLDLELNLGCKSASSSSGSSKDGQKRNSASPDLSERIIVTGCKSCLMYVMLSPKNPQCPRCGSYVVLDISQSPLTKKSKV